MSVYSASFPLNPPIPAAACLPLRERAKQRRMRQPLALAELSCLEAVSLECKGLWSLERGLRTRARGAGTCAVWGCEHISYYYTRSHTRYHDKRGTYTPQADLGRTGVERSKANGPRQSNAKAGAACRHGSKAYTRPRHPSIGGLTPPSSQTRS